MAIAAKHDSYDHSHPWHVVVLKNLIIGMYIFELLYFGSTTHQLYREIELNHIMAYIVPGELVLNLMGLVGVYLENYMITQILSFVHVVKVGLWIYFVTHVDHDVMLDSGYLGINLVILVLMFWYANDIK
ncbi:hypothetical protein HDE_07971 [Halotydeus destructor]|nr:hypothetical protein HDE_11075 [Halotydeus destructor]KAI1290594.1 hypothetical protein HDE_07971 [Halotydeus destructor]